MSITGPGCEACNFKGVVPWSSVPGMEGAFGVKPCDRCGGFSQFTATVLVDDGPCPNCNGVGSLVATTYSVGGPARYPCGVCGGTARRLAPDPSGPQRFTIAPCAAVAIVPLPDIASSSTDEQPTDEQLALMFADDVSRVSPEDDFRPLPSVAEVLAHNARTGGDCFGPWMCVADSGDGYDTARVVMLCVVSHDTGDEVSAEVGAVNFTRNPAARFRPITRRGGALPWPEVQR